MIAGQSFGSDRQTVQYERNIQKRRDVLVSWNTSPAYKNMSDINSFWNAALELNFSRTSVWVIYTWPLRIKIIALPNEQSKILVFYFPQLLTRSWEQYQQFNNKGRGKVWGLLLRKFCWHNIALVHTLNDVTNRLMV